MAILNEDIIGGRGLGLGGDGGGGILSGLILGALLGRGGLGGLGGNNGALDSAVLANVATKEDLNQQTLGDIKASIPFNEAQVQLALQALQASLTGQNTSNTQYLGGQLQNLALGQLVQSNAIQTAIATVDTNVDRQSCAIQNTVHAEGEATRALITNNRIADLEQQLTVAQLRESEQRAINREQVNSHNVTTTVNTNQQQAQLQSQRQDFLLNQLVSGFGQLARATNSSVNVGNTGAIGTSQTANPTNVNA